MERFTIDRLGHQGDGIAQGPVYVPGTLPGEIVTGQRDGQVLKDIRIETPSADRVKAPCAHAKTCGGCQVQHASDDFVASWKRDVVRRALAAHGIETDLSLPVTSPPRSRRRASFSAKRTKKGALAGFHQKASDVVVSVPNCHLLTDAVRGALPMVEALAILAGSRKGELSVTVTQSEGGLDVDVSNGKPLDAELQVQLAAIAREHNVARIAWEGEATITRYPPVQRFDGIAVIPPPSAFMQATQHGEDTLREAVNKATQGAKHILDLFAGCGTFALPLSKTAKVHAVEGDAAMTQALDRAWRNGADLRHVTTQTRDLFRNPLLPEELKRFDAVVMDPPRAGAEAQTAQLADAKPPVIAHISCNPVTFARDTATLLDAGYRLSDLHVVDQFRWSTHVEVVGTLKRD